MKTVLVGAVGSSQVMLECMVAENIPVEYVFSIDESQSENISGYVPLHKLAKEYGIPSGVVRNINDEENALLMERIKPDYIFVVGFSQLVGKRILGAAKKGVVGFHPTPLPKMRGRAANVWQVLLGVHETKCSLFLIDEGMDSGDILGQQEYVIEESDYAADVKRKINEALSKLGRRVLCGLKEGTIIPQKQNEAEATYLLKRTPEDGLIPWDEPIGNIHRLVRAVSRPYPGAFGLYDGKSKIIIWRADVYPNNQFVGINGQIARVFPDGFDVVCRDGLLHVTDYENIDKVTIRVGHKLR